jgi:hypothetical protein
MQNRVASAGPEGLRERPAEAGQRSPGRHFA